MWKVSANPVNPEEAIAWFRSRLPLTKAEWQALEDRARRKAFTVAGVAALDLVAEVWEGLGRALEAGTPYAEWATSVRDGLEAAWGRPNGRRLETIFRTNVQMAYSSGRWAQMSRPEVRQDRPYWMYDAVLDARTTAICRERNGVVRPADDPWWQSNTPPLHFNCRSGVRPLTEAEAQARGITERLPEEPPQKGFGNAPQSWEWSPDPADYPIALWRAFAGRPYGSPAEVRRTLLGANSAYSRAIAQIKDEYKKLERRRGDMDPLEYAQQSATLLARLDQLEAERSRVLRRLLYHRQPSQMRYVIEDPELAPYEDFIRQAVWEFGKLTGASGEIQFGTTADSRSFYWRGKVFLGPRGRESITTMIHEMGHWYEEQTGLLDKTTAWLDARTQGEAPVSLRALFGDRYDENELTRPDRFLHPYIGKVYSHEGQAYATEVLSMGVEWLYKDPLELAQKDGDMFERLLEWTSH